MSEDSHDACGANLGLDVVMLVAVEEKLGFRSGDEICESHEPCVNFIVPVVDSAWTVVCDKNVNGRKIRHQIFDLVLLEQVVALRLVFPRPAESAERHAADRVSFQV